MQLSFHILRSNDSPRIHDLQKLYDAEKDEMQRTGEIAHVGNSSKFLIAYHEGKPVGYTEFSEIKRKNGKPYLLTWKTYVLVPLRKKKIATQLVQHLIGRARKNGITLIRRVNQTPSMMGVVHRMSNSPRTTPTGIKTELFRTKFTPGIRTPDVFIHVRPRKVLRKR